MSKLAILTDTAPKQEVIRRQLGGIFELTFVDLDRIQAADFRPNLLLDINLRDNPRLPDVKAWLSRRPKDGKAIFVTDKASHIEAIQAHALGATGIVHRPLDGYALAHKLSDDLDAIPSDDPENEIKKNPGVVAALDALHDIFSSACLGTPLDLAGINTAGESIVGHIEEQGLKSWIDTVRKHHSQTYQHCLLVTGVAVAFGQQLGFSQADRNRLSFAGMVHDIGKAMVPIAISGKADAAQ